MESKRISLFDFIWSAFDKVGNILITFLLNLILARYFLSPKDFGLIGMISIFIALANTTVIGGFGQAIIQSKNIIKEDYNTVFSFNLSLAVILYSCLFIGAPYIADFYSIPVLAPLVRTLGITLFLNAFIIVPNSHLIRNLRFKRLSFINNVSIVISALCAVLGASLGIKVWAIVVNTLMASFVQVLLLHKYSDAEYSFAFNSSSFKKLFSFGGYMYVSTLIETIYTNGLYLILGKRYSPTLLGYYTQAEKLQGVPVNAISTIINQVTFPHFSKLQDTDDELEDSFLKILKLLSLLSAILIGLLALSSNSFIEILFGKKWIPSIPIFNWLCLAGFFYPLNSTVTSVVKSKGKAKLFFHLQFWKRLVGIIALVILSQYSFEILLMGVVSISFFFFVINILVVNRILSFNLIKLILNIFSVILIPFVVYICCTLIINYLCELYTLNIYLLLSLELLGYISLMGIVLEIIKPIEYIIIKKSITKLIKK